MPYLLNLITLIKEFTFYFLAKELNATIKNQSELTKTTLSNKNFKEPTNNMVKPIENEEDIFKSYMKQKENEFRMQQKQSLSSTKKNPNVNLNDKARPLSSSSSGHSSLSSSNRTSRNCSDTEETTEQHDLKSINKKFYPKTQMSTVVKKPIQTLNPPICVQTSNQDLNTLIQTVNNELKSIRLNLENNKNSEKNKIKNVLSTVYSEDLKDAKSIMTQSLNKVKNQSKLTNELYKSAYDGTSARQPISARSNSQTRPKSVLIPSCKAIGGHVQVKRRSQSVSNSSSPRRSKRDDDIKSDFISRFTIGKDGILNSLLQEFPYLYSSPETIHYLWEKHSKQIEKFAQMQKEIENKFIKARVGSESKLKRSYDDDAASLSSFKESTTKAEQHLKETYDRQQMLMEIMRKDLIHLQRMEDMKRKQEVENSLKARMREQRFQNAKIKRYYEEFKLQQRAKMLKKATSEEMVFKSLFNEALKIQKERILDLRKYAKEKSEISQRDQLNQIESIENFYKNKFDLLNEKIKREKEENLIRNKAQHQVLGKMKIQVKQKLENDIRDLQDQMTRDKDFLHWREADAEKLLHELRSANYYKQKN